MANIKIIIDKRKLDTLLRLNYNKGLLMEYIISGTFEKTNDYLINDYLETLLIIKEFDNWGGKRTNSGRKSKFNQDENQDDCQLEDKDKDKDKDKNKNKKDIYINEQKTYFVETYKQIFNQKPFLSNMDCAKIIELSNKYDREIIKEAIKRLKGIDFKDIGFKPSATWLLKDNNFEKVMNNEFNTGTQKTGKDLMAEIHAELQREKEMKK